MATDIKKISVSLPNELDVFLKQCVKEGSYSSTSEVIRDALRALRTGRTKEQRALSDLRALIVTGIESGPAIQVDIDSVKQEAQRRMNA